MIVPLIFTGLLSLAFTFTLPGQKKSSKETDVRKPAVAGSFYPAGKAELEQYIDALLRQADPPKIAGDIRAVMVPHAGYVYSGPAAAYVYKALEGRDIRTVILMSNSHRQWLDGVALYAKGGFETPLGVVPVDEEKAARLLSASPKIMDRPDIHEMDHVLEVQVPFLQRTLKNFKLVPLLFGNDEGSLSGVLADALKTVVDDKTLIIASSDMSHYPPYENANAADHETITAILTGDPANLDKALSALETKRVPQAETFLCGVSGVRTAMMAAKAEGATEIRLLKYGNSGDTAGDKKRVVGYGAIVFVKPLPGSTPVATAAAPSVKKGAVDEDGLSSVEQKELLKLARLTVEAYVRTKKILPYSPSLKKLETPAGAFVTLKEHGSLRGCIGRFEPNIPLYIVVQQMAVAAATQDPRFPKVSSGELDKLEYEISVLSPLRKVASADEIEIGKHGVDLKRGFNSGVFLPQVATETGWSKEEFLSELCSQKAGLERDCWKDPNTKLYVFTAQVFSEE